MERLAARRVGGFTLLEWAPAIVLVPLATLELLRPHEPLPVPPGWLLPFYATAAVLLLWRHRRPVTVTMMVCSLVLLPAALWGTSHLATWVWSLIVVVLAAGRSAPPPRSYLALSAGMITVLGMLAFDPTDSVASSWGWALNLIWVFGIGALLRSREQLMMRSIAQAEAQATAEAAADRVRLARDLHDVLAHNIAVMVVQAEAAAEVLDTDPDRARRSLAHVGDTGRGALRDIRGLLSTLRTAQSGDEGRNLMVEDLPNARGLDCVPALVDVVRGAGLPVDLDLTDDVATIGGPSGEVGYRVVQEALTNALRHTACAPTTVRITRDRGAVELEIRDAGPGDSAPEPAASGNGLRGMRERVEELGGTLEAGPLPASSGYRVWARLPVGAPR